MAEGSDDKKELKKKGMEGSWLQLDWDQEQVHVSVTGVSRYAQQDNGYGFEDMFWTYGEHNSKRRDLDKLASTDGSIFLLWKSSYGCSLYGKWFMLKAQKS